MGLIRNDRRWSITLVLLSLLLVCGMLLPQSARGDALNLRYPAPSPDGTNICFSYQGDLWLVPSQGGKATRLTVHVGYDGFPVWSPDGRYIAFSSNRNGNFDVFLIPAAGGNEIQLTYNTDDDIVTGWAPDSRKVLFTSRRELENRSVWEIPIDDGNAHPLTRIQSDWGRYSSDGDRLVFTRGAVPWWRKGYRGSAACNVFIKNLKSGKIERTTHSGGNELNAWLIPSGSEVIYLSDSTGSYNLFRKNLISGKVTQITNHRLSAAFPSLSADGSLLAYELNGEIYLYDTRLSQGRKLMVDLTVAGKDNDLTFKTVDSGITEMCLSPDGSQIAYVVGGEVFCRDLTGASQSRVTKSEAEDCDISWSADSHRLVCAENPEGSFNIYMISPEAADRIQPAMAREFSREELASSDRFCMSPSLSPIGGRLAYVRSGSELIVENLDKGTQRTFSNNEPIGDYSWSGDGRYIVYTQLTSDWMNELLIADTESGSIEVISDLPSEYSSPRFSNDGKLIYYLNQGDVYYLYLDRRLAEMTPPERSAYLSTSGTTNSVVQAPVMVDFDDIQNRHVKLTSTGAVTEAVLAPGTNFIVYSERGGKIVARALDGDRQQDLMRDVDSPHQLQFAGASDLLFYLDRDGRIHSLDIQTGETRDYPFRAEWQVSRSEQYKQIFAETWATMREEFYDETLNGTNWGSIKDRYRDRVATVSNDRDFYDIIREMLGEINASHCNIWPPTTSVPEDGWIGIIPDYEENSAAARVDEVVPHSPSARLVSRLDQYDKITAVNGQKVESPERFYSLVLGQTQQEIKLDLLSRNGINRSVYLTPVSTEEFRDLTYNYRVETARDQVAKLSDDKIAYFHLSQVTPKSLDHLEAELLKYSKGRDGMILDLRGNIGGTEHDRLIQILSRRKYISHHPRHGKPGFDANVVVPPNLTVLVDERTSSDAEIVAQGIRELGLGEIVGVRSYGAVIGTEQKTLLNGATLSIPSVGWFSMSGDNLENNGVQPDFVIPLDLTAADKGEDNQLKEATERLLQRM